MPDTVKRNKKIFEHIKSQMVRLGLIESTLHDFYMNFVLEGLSAGIILAFSGKLDDEVKPEILNDENILIETLKVIGIMEASKDVKELTKLLGKRGEIKQKDKKKEKTDFDKILGGIMKVPKPKDDKKFD